MAFLEFRIVNTSKKISKVYQFTFQTMKINGNGSLAFIDYQDRAILVSRQFILLPYFVLLQSKVLLK